MVPILAASALFPTPCWTQTPASSDSRPCAAWIALGAGDLSGAAAEFARTAEVAGVAPLRARLARRTSDEAEVRICEPDRLPGNGRVRLDQRNADLAIRLLPQEWIVSVNSAYPDDRNDGALWNGRGFNSALSAGAAARWGPLSAALAPRLIFQQNRDVDIVTTVQPAGYSRYIHPWHPTRIDWPQRFGDRSFWTLEPGQSYIRVDVDPLVFGLSTENLWWGPAQRHALILSNTAAGFPHLVLGTRRPVDTRLGAVGAQIVWGSLAESAYFDGDLDNDHRLFAGFVLDYQPAIAPGLFLGLTRGSVIAVQPAGISLVDRVLAPFTVQTSSDGGAARYQILGLFARWVFPEAGFEVYGEWTRRGPWPGLASFIREPERGRGYLIGFQHVMVTGRRWVRLYGEHANVNGPADAPRDGSALAFYTDTRVPQGYTHRGQLLGAAIGPGSDGQILGADLLFGAGRVGLFGERRRRDEDAYYAYWTRYYGPNAHDVELGGGVRGLLHLGGVRLDGELGYGRRRNRSFLRLDGYNWDLLRESNWSLRAGVQWTPPMR